MTTHADQIEAAEKEHAQHVVGFATTYKNGVVDWEDRGGIRCSCGWSAEREAPTATRPWHLWHRHVVAAVLAALTPEPVAGGLTEAERESLYDAASKRLVRMPSSNPWDYVGELIPHIERILAARAVPVPAEGGESRGRSAMR